MEAKQEATQDQEAQLTTSAAKVEAITNAALRVMADFATRATPYATFTEGDIVASIIADPKSPTALYFADLIAKSIKAVATLDYADSLSREAQ